MMDDDGKVNDIKKKLCSTDVLNKLNDAIENQEEGIVVKDAESYYMASRRNAGWYKVKPEVTKIQY